MSQVYSQSETIPAVFRHRQRRFWLVGLFCLVMTVALSLVVVCHDSEVPIV